MVLLLNALLLGLLAGMFAVMCLPGRSLVQRALLAAPLAVISLLVLLGPFASRLHTEREHAKASVTAAALSRAPDTLPVRPLDLAADHDHVRLDAAGEVTLHRMWRRVAGSPDIDMYALRAGDRVLTCQQDHGRRPLDCVRVLLARLDESRAAGTGRPTSK